MTIQNYNSPIILIYKRSLIEINRNINILENNLKNTDNKQIKNKIRAQIALLKEKQRKINKILG